ncbi:hypothetical protein FHR70_004839 [Microvirga lupini]|jgi:hypothetical protein|uniref:Uncharacterized protein n=1 Tax=Microvirga lupini TaxID=420324 RepID=A0A7W4VR19_9HYPH|nr:hypothetical protein [Microvirga lupini]MBB3021733.1 hypothetical protein [Microvirga lupini]MDF2969978.1 hypothetical protein [Microvirga sp.]
MFTLTISDKPVAITNANEEEARELLMSEEFKDDLKVLESEGAPLWDGFASLNVRPATEEEKTEFEGADFDEDEEDDDEEEGPYIMFLVDVTDPDEDDEG